MIHTASPAARKEGLPRPWLRQQHVLASKRGARKYSRKEQIVGHESSVTNVRRDLMVLDRPNLGISWHKLSMCFCLDRTTSKTMRECRHQSQQHYKPPPFPGLAGVIRRHSSFSLPDEGVVDLVYGECFPPHQCSEPPKSTFHACDHTEHHSTHHHQKHRHHECSVSEFTESETSSYFSISEDDEEQWANANARTGMRFGEDDVHRDASWKLPPITDVQKRVLLPESDRVVEKDVGRTNVEAQQAPPSPVTPLPRSARPPVISIRHRSAGLPPLNPSPLPNNLHPQDGLPVGRLRTDTGDFTKNTQFTRTSGTTNTSRHRRAHDHFSFSSQSISEIYNNGESGEATNKQKQCSPKSPPPSYVSFQDKFAALSNGEGGIARPTSLRLADRGVSDVSALEFNESFGGDSLNISALEYREEAGADAAAIDMMYGDLVGLDVNVDSDDESDSPFAELKKHQLIPAGKVSCSKKTQNMVRPAKKESFYLRKDSAMDGITKGQLVLSGWVSAFIETPGADPPTSLLSLIDKISSRDMHYMRVVVSSPGQASLLLYCPDDGVVSAFEVDQGWKIESREVDGRIGRAVTIQSESLSLVLLPVSVDDAFFASNGDLVSETEFANECEELFVRPGHFAPDEQMDTVMYIFFTIDSLVKQRRVY